jgi:hypothetical protein
MLYLVSTNEYSGIGTQRVTVNYGIFSSEQKAKSAINDICEKLAQITKKTDTQFFIEDIPKFKDEYIKNFDITKMPDVDSQIVFINRTPNW